MTKQGKPPKNPRGLAAFSAALSDSLAVRGVTKAELAERIGKSPSAVVNWTLGRDMPSPDTVFAIEDALGLAGGHLSRLLGFCPCDESAPSTVEEAVMADPKLPSEQKRLLVGIYRVMVSVAT